MAKKKIRECDGKRILKANAARLTKMKFEQLRPVMVTAETDWKKLRQQEPWMLETKLVAKPDMMFGKRGKHDLVLLNATLDEVKTFVQERVGKVMTIGAVTGTITHFLVEPFIPHDVEYYFSIVSERESTHIYFSLEGGIDIESGWENKVRSVSIPVGQTLDDISEAEKASLYNGVAPELLDATQRYLSGMFAIFEDLDFVSIETNPFVFVKDNDSWEPLPLDLCAELDDTARFKNTKKWGDLQFPDVFGHLLTPEERFVEELDASTGASLKLTILNPEGLIWNLVAGGGASVIFADTVADLGYGKLLGNYGEYSGAPNSEQTYHYTKTLLDVATRPRANGEFPPATVLLIGGGIANFTDVAKTFKGIVHALKEYKERMQAVNMRIYVRRAGPNYQTGLELMKTVGKDLGVPIEVFGPERNMTEIIPMAIEYIRSKVGEIPASA